MRSPHGSAQSVRTGTEYVGECKLLVLGEEHPDTLKSMENHALTLKSQGQNDQAVSLMQNAVNLQTKVFGLDHPETVNSLMVLRQWYG